MPGLEYIFSVLEGIRGGLISLPPSSSLKFSSITVDQSLDILNKYYSRINFELYLLVQLQVLTHRHLILKILIRTLIICNLGKLTKIITYLSYHIKSQPQNYMLIRRYISSKPNKYLYNFATSAINKNLRKTFYQVLEVPSNATITNIKKNYLRLAKIYHPDVYKGKDKQRFTKINQAYKILSDRVKRNKYDEQIGLQKKNNDTAQPNFTTANQASAASQEFEGRANNNMSYETSAQYQQQPLNLDEQFNKFFSQKPKTQFEQIRLNEQPQFRGMSEAERIRRHFSNVYQSPDRMHKAEYQKQYGSILNDQINQSNRMHDDLKTMQKRNQKLNSQKNQKKIRKFMMIGFGVFFLISMSMINSFITKYRLEKEKEQEYLQIIKRHDERFQEQSVRARFKFEN